MSGIASTVGIALLAACVGVAVGWAHFRGLRTVANALVAGRFSGVLLQLARFAGLGLFLYLCARFGAVALLAAAAGLMAGRSIVLRGADREGT